MQRTRQGVGHHLHGLWGLGLLFDNGFCSCSPLADFLASIDKEGMDLDKESDVSGGTLLTWAAEFHRSDICRVLLERNADPLKKSRVEKMNALEWATRTPARGSDGAQERDQVISMLTKSAQ